ncbi:hypothetical protein TNCV_2505021 [Trichonephila clavipes]|uniref:Uncharacterized protein n=1 Tax=Trichonephila clavipes TaxID=2585209 RepID=A0A8X6WH14_TRICX|nr:hypothetical protein TNCV_2505021 [Trichonephila clavipes]
MPAMVGYLNHWATAAQISIQWSICGFKFKVIRHLNPQLFGITLLESVILLSVDSIFVQELLWIPCYQELTIDELIEMHEQEQGIERHDYLDLVQSENRMTVGNLTEGLSFIEKRLQTLENTYSKEERIFFKKSKE